MSGLALISPRSLAKALPKTAPIALACCLLPCCKPLGSATAQTAPAGSPGPSTVQVSAYPAPPGATTGGIEVFTDWKALLITGAPSQVTVALRETNGPIQASYVFTPGGTKGDPGIDATGTVDFSNLPPGGYSVKISATGASIGSNAEDVIAQAGSTSELYLPVHPATVGLPPTPPSACGSTGILGELEGDDHWIPIVDQPLEAYGSVRGSWFADVDLPADHDGHDRNFYLAPDDDYAGLLSDSNDTDVRYDGHKLMECEWDSGFNPNNQSLSLPLANWPIVGDRTWVSGPWIYDCDHSFSGFQIPYHTEFHSWAAAPFPMAEAFTRFDPTMYLPTDTAPSLTYRTYITIRSGFGAQDYVFDVPMPPMPAGARPVYRLDQPAPPGIAVQLTPIIPDGVIQVGDPLAVMSPSSIQSRIARLRIHLQIDSGAGAAGYAGTITAGWWEPTSTLAYKQVQVAFQSLQINDIHAIPIVDWAEPTSWWMWVQAGDQWLDWNGISALHSLESAVTLPVNETTHPFFVLDPGAAQDQALSSLWIYGFPKSAFAADVDDTGWRSGSMDYHFGCVTCPTNLIENVSFGEIPDQMADNASNSIPVPAAGSQPFGPMEADTPTTGQGNPADNTVDDHALSGTITTLDSYPAGLQNPQPPTMP